ncbi:hypothetical protein BaRGS_00028817, partial [Batillaria attramentaria]
MLRASFGRVRGTVGTGIMDWNPDRHMIEQQGQSPSVVVITPRFPVPAISPRVSLPQQRTTLCGKLGA